MQTTTAAIEKKIDFGGISEDTICNLNAMNREAAQYPLDFIIYEQFVLLLK